MAAKALIKNRYCGSGYGVNTYQMAGGDFKGAALTKENWRGPKPLCKLPAHLSKGPNHYNAPNHVP
jgi:hypothetical protein